MTFIKFILAYITCSLFLALGIAVTFFWPNITDMTLVFDERLFFQMVVVVGFFMFFCALIVSIILGGFAFAKKIRSPAYYAFCWVCVAFLVIVSTPGLQSVDGRTEGFWVPFFGFIFAILAGYIFWYIAVKPLSSKSSTLIR